MSDELVKLERRDDGVAVVRLDRPKVNALNAQLVEQLAAIAAALTAEPPGAVVVTGGERIFAAGADIAEFGGQADAERIAERLHAALATLAAVPRLVIAAVAGYALGGGCELALACDYRIAADTAVFGQPEVLLGIIPGGGGTQRLPRLVGPARAKELIITGRQVKADEALRIGLADEVVPAAELHDRAFGLAADVARGPLVAHALMKRAVDSGLDVALDDALALERNLFVEVFGTEDSHTGVKSFLEHGPGKATFAGR